MRGYAKPEFLDAIRAAGGEVFGVTSEPQTLANEATESWELGFPCIGDPHQEILGVCRERNWLDLFVNEHSGDLGDSEWISNPKGYFQPGVLALARDGRVLYRWRSRPTHKNLGGAVERPAPAYVRKQVEARLAGSAEDAPLDASPELDMKAPPWAFFVLLLLAHGWFLRPKPFPLARARGESSTSPQQMLPRAVGFVGAWIAAFLLLPAGWVALALLAWAALVAPGVALVHREFQHVPGGDGAAP